jgi:MATE family multidrug resistance protein
LGRPWLVEWAFAASDASGAVKEVARSYFTIRLWGAPAALCNLVILGWLLGRQDARAPMLILIASNSLNIVLDIWLVRGVGWGVQGAALASLLADYASLLLGGYCVTRHRSIAVLRTQWHDLLRSAKPYRHMLALNRDIFIRSLCLQACFVFMTFQGAKLGDVVVAANAVLLNFLMLLSYGLDGFAYAAEAMVGRAVGARRRDQLARAIRLNLQWALLTALLATLAFVWGGELLIRAMTSIDAVVAEALRQLPWLMALPLLSVWAYLFDGIFIGATRAREMRDSMLLAVLVGYFPVWWLAGGDNSALWAAMLVLMVGRGVGLGVWLYRLWHSHALVD